MRSSKGRTWRNRRKRVEHQDGDTLPNDLGRDYQSLLKWAAMKGFEVKQCVLMPYSFKETGRGMACKQSLSKGTTIIKIPAELLITTQLVMTSNIGNIISRKRIEGLTPVNILCAYLMVEKHYGSSSSYAPYIRSLPTSYTTPCYWSEEEINALPPWIKEKAVHQCQELQKSFSACGRLILELDKLIPGFAESAKYEVYCWAWCTVNTRAVYMDQTPNALLGGSVDNLALAPVLDMLNHSVHIQVDAGFNKKSRCYEIKTHDSYRKGNQVFISYGPHDNSKLLVEYGFVVPDNPHNCVPFDLGELGEAARDEDVASLPEKVQIICAAQLHQNMCCSLDGISWNLNTSCQILMLSPNQIGVWKDCMVGEMHDEKHRLMTKSFMIKLLSRKIPLCALPKDFQINNYQREMIERVCREQADILRHCIGTIT